MFGHHHRHDGWRGHLRERLRERMHDCAPPFGRGGRGPFGGGAEGPFRPGGRGPGGPGGRVFGHGDLRLALLALIAEKPRHGYDLIRDIEEQFGGAYAPSPGAVYPTLTMLEEQDLIRGETSEGTRRRFEVTEAGRAFLQEHKASVEAVMTRMKMFASAYAGRATPDAVREAYRTLKHALSLREGGGWSAAEAERVRAILERAAGEIIARPENN